MEILVLSCAISLVLLIWFRTEAVVEYGRLLGLSSRLHLDEYEDKKISDDIEYTYPQYLRMKKPTFFIKLITCPICLSVWLSFILICLVRTITLGVYPLITILSLIIYGITKKLL